MKRYSTPSKYSGKNDYYPKNIGELSYNDNSENDWKEFRQEVLDNKIRSQDDFEKYLNIFGGGGLFIGLTILGKIVENNSSYALYSCIIIGSICFLLSLLLNLISHHFAIFYDNKNIEDIDSKNQNIIENLEKRNNKIDNLNKSSLSFIILGTILISIFLIYNINTMAQKNQEPKTNPTQKESKPSSNQNGRTTSKPSFKVKTKK